MAAWFYDVIAPHGVQKVVNSSMCSCRVYD